MKAWLSISLSILLAVVNLAHSQEKPKFSATGEPTSREFVTPATTPKEIFMEPGTSSKGITIDPAVPGSPTTEVDIKKGPKGEINIIIKSREVPFRPTGVQTVSADMPLVKADIAVIVKSKAYPLIKELGGEIAKTDIKLVNYEKQKYRLLYVPVIKEGTPTDSFISVYEFPKRKQIILYRLLGEYQIELVDGTTGEKTILKFTPEGQLESSILSPKKSRLSFLLTNEAYALEWKGIKDCIAEIFKKAENWVPTCGSCIALRFKGPTCKICMYQLLGIVGECLQKITPK